MTQKKLQSQVEEEHMSEQNKPEILKMEVEALSKNEEFARVAVAVFLARLNPTLEEVDDVKTAVSEAVTNAVIHGYQGKGGMIYLEVEVIDQEFTITIRDIGIGIPDIKQAMEPLYTTDPDGERTGMGFSFMEAFMDQVEVQSAPGEGTAVTMKKKISG
jgi:stage II sporulation protein AB (anti-sigma F factor)